MAVRILERMSLPLTLELLFMNHVTRPTEWSPHKCCMGRFAMLKSTELESIDVVIFCQIFKGDAQFFSGSCSHITEREKKKYHVSKIILFQRE